jgi:hypothetical protein
MDEAGPKPKGSTVRPAKAKAANPDISAAIGRQLKTAYDGILNEPVPEALSELVKKLSGKIGK